MYRCESCKKVVGPAVPSHRVTVATRFTTYPVRPQVHRQRLNGKTRWVDDPGGVGEEIVREQQVCSACARTSSRAGPMH